MNWMYLFVTGLFFLLGAGFGYLYAQHDYEDYRLLKKLTKVQDAEIANLKKLMAMKDEEYKRAEDDLAEAYADIDYLTKTLEKKKGVK